MTKIEPGLYVHVKQMSVGTGHTSKENQTARSIWAYCAEKGNGVDLMLLDDKLRPTGLVEFVASDDLDDYNFHGLGDTKWPVLHGRVMAVYQKKAAARPRKPPLPAAQTPATPDAAPPASDQGNQFDTTNWWDKIE